MRKKSIRKGPARRATGHFGKLSETSVLSQSPEEVPTIGVRLSGTILEFFSQDAIVDLGRFGKGILSGERTPRFDPQPRVGDSVEVCVDGRIGEYFHLTRPNEESSNELISTQSTRDEVGRTYSLALSHPAEEMLEALASRAHGSKGEVLSKAIALYKMAVDASDEGNRVCIVAPDGPTLTEFVGL